MEVAVSNRSLPSLLPAILLLGFALRIGWIITQAPILTIEGSEYVRMGENLAHGNGLVGLWGDPETMYGPTFPMLIAAVNWLLPSAETAAHLILLILGTGLIAAVFLIAQIMYGRRVAYVCAMLAALHPLLVKDAANVYNE